MYSTEDSRLILPTTLVTPPLAQEHILFLRWVWTGGRGGRSPPQPAAGRADTWGETLRGLCSQVLQCNNLWLPTALQLIQPAAAAASLSPEHQQQPGSGETLPPPPDSLQKWATRRCSQKKRRRKTTRRRIRKNARQRRGRRWRSGPPRTRGRSLVHALTQAWQPWLDTYSVTETRPKAQQQQQLITSNNTTLTATKQFH